MNGWFEAVKRQTMLCLRRARNDDAVLFLGLFVTCVLVNGILAILLIELLQTLGVWATTGGGEPMWLVDWRPQPQARPPTLRGALALS